MSTSSPKSWRCAVCGYVHRGHELPASCPVCGVDASAFELQAGPPPAPAAQPAVTRWRCAVCGYVHEGAAAPAACPLCGAGREAFEPTPEEGPRPTPDLSVRVVILGAGVAGVCAAEAARAAAPGARIVLLGKEAALPYYRINLTRYLAGEVARDALHIHPEGWYTDRRIELRCGVEAARLDLAGHAVELRGGERLPFDKLILTAGAHPFVPPIPGAQREGVWSLRTLEEADRILEAARPGARCVCIGGGLLGLEMAGGLVRRGADITVLEGHGHLMPSQLDPRAGGLLADHLARIGVTLRAAVHTRELVGDERVAGVLLEEGDTIPADLVLLATGVRPNSYLARRAGLDVQKGVVVDNLLRTSHPDVLAAGDAAEHLGVLYGNWNAAQLQGGIAGGNAAGLGVEFGGMPRAHTLKVLGLDTFSLGQFTPPDGSFRQIAGEADGAYRSFVFRDGRLVGANLVGSTALAGAVKQAVESRRDFSELLSRQPAACDIAVCLAGG
jgi:nitrite reductase (NADH) large subunit